MDSIELMLRLLEVKASHYWGSSFTYAQTHYEERFEGTPCSVAREELYDAKCGALRDFIAEIRACMAATTMQALAPTAGERDERCAFITEMAGTMTAAICNTLAELDDARDRSDRDHDDHFKDNGNAKAAWNSVEITPRSKVPPQVACLPACSTFGLFSLPRSTASSVPSSATPKPISS